MSSSQRSPSTAPASARWLFGPGVDLLAGCGVGYLFVFIALALAGTSVQRWLPNTILPLLSLVAGAPHYGATLLRVYRRREDRQHYASVAVLATGLIGGAFVLSLSWYALGSFLVSLYLLWSPWHYSAQNYGLGLMFLGRRRVPVDPLLRRSLRVAFILPFVIFTVQVNGASPVSLFGATGLAAPEAMPPAYRPIPIGIPHDLQMIAMLALIGLQLAALAFVSLRLLRVSSLRDAAPTLTLLGTQALWFAIPACARFWQLGQGIVPLEARSSVYAFHYVAAAHAFQYIWVTIYFDRKAGNRDGAAGFYLRSMLAGQAIWTVPLVVFAPALGARFSFSADLALLVAAVVNLHHFVLDGAIWKLRDARVGSVLMRDPDGRRRVVQTPRRPWVMACAWSLGAAILLVEATMHLERHAFGVALASSDLDRAERALAHLDWIGRADSELLVQFGLRAEQSGDRELAYRSFRRSAAARDNPSAHLEMARLHQARGEWKPAAAELERGYALSEDLPPIVFRSMADTLVRAGRRERAIEILEAGERRFPTEGALREQLRQLRARDASRG